MNSLHQLGSQLQLQFRRSMSSSIKWASVGSKSHVLIKTGLEERNLTLSITTQQRFSARVIFVNRWISVNGLYIFVTRTG